MILALNVSFLRVSLGSGDSLALRWGSQTVSLTQAIRKGTRWEPCVVLALIRCLHRSDPLLVCIPSIPIGALLTESAREAVMAKDCRGLKVRHQRA